MPPITSRSYGQWTLLDPPPPPPPTADDFVMILSPPYPIERRLGKPETPPAGGPKGDA